MKKSRDEMLRLLHSIEKPIITEFGYYATGVEFKVLTDSTGTWCSWSGAEPIDGPFSMTKAEHEAMKQAISLDIEDFGHRSSVFFGNDLVDYIEENEITTITKEDLEPLIGMDDERTFIVFEMVRNSCKPNTEYYGIFDMFTRMYEFFNSYEDAEEDLVNNSEGEGKAWEDMTNDELEDWFEEYCIANKIDLS